MVMIAIQIYRKFVMLNEVKHLFCMRQSLIIDPSFLRMTKILDDMVFYRLSPTENRQPQKPNIPVLHAAYKYQF